MKLLFVISDALRVVGGTPLASAALLRRLARDCSHHGIIVTPHPVPRASTIGGIEVIAYRDLEELVALVRQHRPDVVVGALGASVDAMRVARRFGIPGVLCIHTYDLCEPTAAEKQAWGIHPDCPFPPPAAAEYALRTADRIFSCSRHMQRFLEERRGLHSEVLYSEWDPAELLFDPGSFTGEYVTAVCGFRHKGIEIFLHLARAFPRERFLLAGDLDADIALAYRRALRDEPNVHLPGRLTLEELLGRSKIVLVPSRLPEPFGRVAVEAMANGVPVLASATGGLLEIIGSGPMAVTDFTDPEEWEHRLAALLASDRLREDYASRGRELAAPFLAPTTTRSFAATLESLIAGRRPDFDGGRLLMFEGEEGRVESFSLINESWRRALCSRGVVCRPHRPEELELPDAVIHHDYTRNLLDFAFPDSGKAVAVKSWDFGAFPPELVRRINDCYDQFWIHSRWVEEHALASGIEPGLVRRVPPGVDPEMFRPDGPTYALPTERAFAFLFVGGTVLRKGIDILLAAYRMAFSRTEDVCLVIKDSTRNVFFAGKTYHEEILRLARDPSAPALVYLDGQLPVEDLAALYRTCDVAVFPYRAEGFVLPILEAMACGTPAMVPRLGPCLDYCSDETSFLVPAIRVQLPVNRRMKLGLGFEYQIPSVDFCEIRVETLAEHLRLAYETPVGRRAAMATKGVARAHGSFTWERAGARVAECLAELADGAPPRRLVGVRTDGEKSYRRLELARRLFHIGGSELI